ncbi:MAG: 2-phosphosulfolactate phosphatase [Chitinophagales bacterium]|nr:2-phosphosulfolactate phosphatase [Chitinophagales bacterium]
MKQKPCMTTCLSPELLSLYNLEESVVVAIDVLRATSTIASALYHGANAVIPVSTVEECIEKGQKPETITAGERNGITASGLQYGNSPLLYQDGLAKNKTLILTTTNGTALIHKSLQAKQILTGSFPNISTLCEYLKGQSTPIILACAGWKGQVNLEDTLFAGAVATRLDQHFDTQNDTTLLAQALYNQYQHDLPSLIRQSSHYKRLGRLGIYNDIQYCMSFDTAPVLPFLYEGQLVNKKF